MKFGTPIFLLLLIAFAFMSVALIVKDFRTYYPTEENVSTENYEDIYDFSLPILGNFTGNGSIREKLENLDNKNKGWQIFSNIVAIPLVIIKTIIFMVLTIPYLMTILVGFATTLHVPAEIIGIAVTTLIVVVVIMLIKFYQRSPSA